MQVTLQTERTTLARLAKASMCTGYQLFNAEMRLLLERGALAASADVETTADCQRDEPCVLSPTEQSRLSRAAAAHVAALEARLKRLEEQISGDRAGQVRRNPAMVGHASACNRSCPRSFENWLLPKTSRIRRCAESRGIELSQGINGTFRAAHNSSPAVCSASSSQMTRMFGMPSQACKSPAPNEPAAVAARVWSDVESNELLLYVRRLEPSLLETLARPRSDAVDAAFDGLVNVLVGSLVRCTSSIDEGFAERLRKVTIRRPAAF